MLDLENPSVQFTTFDRCDRCGAQAYSLAKKEGILSELLFCLHHHKQYEDALVLDNWTVIGDNSAMEKLVGVNAELT